MDAFFCQGIHILGEWKGSRAREDYDDLWPSIREPKTVLIESILTNVFLFFFFCTYKKIDFFWYEIYEFYIYI